MVSLTDIRTWLGNRADDVTNDWNRATESTKEALVNRNVNANITRRDLIKGGVGAVTVGALGEKHAYTGTASAAKKYGGVAWEELGEASPYEIRSPITSKEDSQEDTEEPTDTAEPTEKATEEPTSTPTPTPELEYSSISDGLLEEKKETRNGFQGYSLTALDSELEGIGYEEAVENTDEYKDAIEDALEGTEYDDGIFRLGEYGVTDDKPEGRGVNLIEDIDASNKFDSYIENLDERGELEDQMVGYFENLERSDL